MPPRAPHWLPFVLGPALAMDRTPGPRWLSVKFSSANLRGARGHHSTSAPSTRVRAARQGAAWVHAHAGCGALVAIDAAAARTIVVCKVASLAEWSTPAHQSAAAVYERSMMQGYAARSSLHGKSTMSRHASMQQASALVSCSCMKLQALCTPAWRNKSANGARAARVARLAHLHGHEHVSIGRQHA